MNIKEIISIETPEQFEKAALELFAFQATECEPYREYINLLGVDIEQVKHIEQIPFMPISLFKSHKVYCGSEQPEICFTSSSTGGGTPSCHYMSTLQNYEACFIGAFTKFYGNPSRYSIYGLLPNYLQREGSSLVYMVNRLIAMGSGRGGFYLDNYEQMLHDISLDQSPKIILGVSYALWELAERYPTKLDNTIIMETGGMKGHREELPKEEFHAILKSAFGVDSIHSEYGMAELTSQGYSYGAGVFQTSPWMKVLIRDINDPTDIQSTGRGGVNIIDLGNISSCAFIQSEDLGVMQADGSFKILGRIDHSEIRGCNLLVQ